MFRSLYKAILESGTLSNTRIFSTKASAMAFAAHLCTFDPVTHLSDHIHSAMGFSASIMDSIMTTLRPFAFETVVHAYIRLHPIKEAIVHTRSFIIATAIHPLTLKVANTKDCMHSTVVILINFKDLTFAVTTRSVTLEFVSRGTYRIHSTMESMLRTKDAVSRQIIALSDDFTKYKTQNKLKKRLIFKTIHQDILDSVSRASVQIRHVPDCLSIMKLKAFKTLSQAALESQAPASACSI